MMVRNAKNTLLGVALLLSLVALVGCTEVESSRTRTGNAIGGSTGGAGGNKGNGAVPGSGGLIDTEEIEDPVVEIRHLIEPQLDLDEPGGAYTRKLTLPKNYNQLLYLAGINVGTLADKNISVRFKFGLTSEPIIVPATVSSASGLTPQTNVEVLVMDLRGKPFEDIQLIYDLYDYNDYSFHGSSSASALSEPVTDNRDDNLFCRGLPLGLDPTFDGAITDGCTDASDICKYSYAKIVDKGLVLSGAPDAPITPSKTNIQATTTGTYDSDTDAVKLGRCLPDNPELSGANYQYIYNYNANSVDPEDIVSFGLTGTNIVINSNTYKFEGPYRPVNQSNWQITSNAIYNSKYGIFGDSMSGTITKYGIQSKLFPLYTKFSLTQDTEYVGSSNVADTKTLMQMNSNTDTAWMDGCNERVATLHEVTGEHYGSCNVTGTIEIIATDDDGNEEVIDITDEVKLQLVKPASFNSNGENVLLQGFSACDSSSQCGSESCCFNNRCWDKQLVSQCLEDVPSYGNGVPGSTCSSDFDCASFCCSPSTGKCAVHDTLQNDPVYCSKPSGSFCIAKEWCMQHTVTECFIVKTGTDVLGNTTCALRCYTSQQFGDCKEGLCIPPAQPSMPTFNPSDPNRCNSAIDPPY